MTQPRGRVPAQLVVGLDDNSARRRVYPASCGRMLRHEGLPRLITRILHSEYSARQGLLHFSHCAAGTMLDASHTTLGYTLASPYPWKAGQTTAVHRKTLTGDSLRTGAAQGASPPAGWAWGLSGTINLPFWIERRRRNSACLVKELLCSTLFPHHSHYDPRDYSSDS